MPSNPLAIGFIIDVNPITLPTIKKQLITVMTGIDLDEKACVYYPGIEGFPKRPGHSVAEITKYTPTEIDLNVAIKQLLYFMRQEWHLKKFIFIITDKSVDLELVVRSENKILSGSEIYLLNLGDKLSESAQDYYYIIDVNVESLGEKIRDICEKR